MVGKYAKKNNQLYLYKNLLRIIPLAMVDDLLAAANCGFDSIEMNISINKIIELKILKLHTPEEKKKSKCHFLHIVSKGMGIITQIMNLLKTVSFMILKTRRINFLHYLANLNKNEILYTFFETQWKYL